MSDILNNIVHKRFMRYGKKIWFHLVLHLMTTTFIILVFGGCHPQKSPMQTFQEAVKSVMVEVEDQNLGGLRELLHESFLDQQERNRDQLLDWLTNLMKHRKDVVVNLLDIEEISPPLGEEAGEISLDVVVSSGSLKIVRKLVGFYGRLVRMTIFVVNDQSWRIISAEWREIDLADLSVMAVDEFKKLFPDGG